MKKELIIYGVGKFAEYVQYVFDNDSEYKVVAFAVEESFRHSDSIFQRPLVSFGSLENHYPPNLYSLFIAVGHNMVRSEIFYKAKEKGYELANYLSTKATTWDDLKYGHNCFIGEGSVIQPFVKLGNNCILFSAQIGHHSRIGSDVLVSAMTIGGNVEIGDKTFLGMNSTIAQNVKVGQNVVIGMGCSITGGNVAPNSVYSNKGTTRRKVSFEEVSKKFLK